MNPPPTPQPRRVPRSWLALLILGAGLALTAAFWQQSRARHQRDLETSLGRQSAESLARIEARLAPSH